MQRIKLNVCLLIAISFISIQAFTQKKLLVLGSSTSACYGPSVPDSCYLQRLLFYYNNPTVTISLDNRAISGFNVYKSMPLGYIPPAGRDAPVGYYNITDGLAANPDVVLVNYPSNMYDVFSIAEVLNCLRTIKQAANNAGKPCYITTTQPRSGFDAAARTKLKILRDSILNAFGGYAIDFYSGLSDRMTDSIAAPYRVPGDPVHLNNTGHGILYQRVLAKNIFKNLILKANAGNDRSVTLPASIYLDSKASTLPGTPVVYTWSFVAGPAEYNIISPSSASSYVNGLVPGIYTFRLTIKDDKGNVSSDDVTVTVNPAVIATPPPPPLAANAGTDVSVVLPASAYIDGKLSTAPGTIASYSWTKVAGGAANIVTPNSISSFVNGLDAGVYTFRLTIKDDKGATASDDVVVTVSESPGTPPPASQPPVAKAGEDFSITLPASPFLDGKNSSAQGTIVTYSWTKVNGPLEFNIVSPNSSSTFVNGLVPGLYTFRLTIKDDKGQTASDDINVTVVAVVTQPGVITSLIAKAGPDITLVLPNSTFLDGKGSTSTGNIISYAWTKVTGPDVYHLVTPNTVSTYLNGLVAGVYTFRLTIKDDKNNVASDDVMVTVTENFTTGGTPEIHPPVANAGNDISITLPFSTLLDGKASTASGSIISYAWTKVLGPDTYHLVTPNSVSTYLNGLVAGVYTFRLTIKDDKDMVASDDVVVTVKAGTSAFNGKTGSPLENNFVNALTIAPNPVSGILNIKWNDDYRGAAHLYIIDGSSKISKKQSFIKHHQVYTSSLDVSSLKPGLFVLEILISGDQRLIKEFIKK